MLVITVFILIMNQLDFGLVHNHKENCQYECILFQCGRNYKKQFPQCRRKQRHAMKNGAILRHFFLGQMQYDPRLKFSQRSAVEGASEEPT